MNSKYKGYYDYLVERESIRHKKTSGQPKPWTTDAALAYWSFCNVNRNDDRTSQWFIDNVMKNHKHDRRLALWNVMLFRWFNRIETGETMLKHGMDDPSNWDIALARQEISKQEKFMCSAYRILAYNIGRLNGITQILDEFHQTLDERVNHLESLTSFEEAYKYLRQTNFFGPFNTYQFCLDMMHTDWSTIYSDKKTWCIAGPGAIRGLNWIHGREVSLHNKKLLNGSHDEMIDIHNDRPITLNHLWVSDIQHNLCEWDKYNRIQSGGKLRRKYNGAK